MQKNNLLFLKKFYKNRKCPALRDLERDVCINGPPLESWALAFPGLQVVARFRNANTSLLAEQGTCGALKISLKNCEPHLNISRTALFIKSF